MEREKENFISNESAQISKNPGSPKKFKNYWVISTIVLAVVVVVLLISNFSTPTISANVVGQKVISFASSQGASAELISVEEESDLFKVLISINDQEFPVYVTKDGKNLIPSLVPLESSDTETPAQTPTNTQPTQTQSNIPKNSKPVVEAFVMSHCPYGTQIEKGLIPVVNLLKDKIDFKIKFVYYAMHPSAGEVQEELNQYCIQEEENDKYIDYLTCFLESGDGAKCLDSAKIDKTKLATCVDKTDKEFKVTENLNDQTKWLSGRYPKFDIFKADNEKYGIGGSPTLIVNGVEAQSGRDSASLLLIICGAFGNVPEECSTQLSSAQPSSGFGFSTTAHVDSAQCG